LPVPLSPEISTARPWQPLANILEYSLHFGAFASIPSKRSSAAGKRSRFAFPDQKYRLLEQLRFSRLLYRQAYRKSRRLPALWHLGVQAFILARNDHNFECGIYLQHFIESAKAFGGISCGRRKPRSSVTTDGCSRLRISSPDGRSSARNTRDSPPEPTSSGWPQIHRPQRSIPSLFP